MRRLIHALLVGAALCGPLVILGATDAGASIAYESPYTFDQTYQTAFRLLRVDLGLKITEKDAQNGYLLFEYTSPESGKRAHAGSMEIVRSKDGARVAVQLPELPQYHEQMIVDALVKKLATEHGQPPKKPKPSPTPDEDAGAADGSAAAP